MEYKYLIYEKGKLPNSRYKNLIAICDKETMATFISKKGLYIVAVPVFDSSKETFEDFLKIHKITLDNR